MCKWPNESHDIRCTCNTHHMTLLCLPIKLYRYRYHLHLIPRHKELTLVWMYITFLLIHVHYTRLV